MRLGLGQGLGAGQSSGGLTIVRDGLIMQHKYNASAVQPLSDGAVYTEGSEYIDLGETTTVSGAFSVAGWFYPTHVTENYIMGVGSTDYLRINSATEITIRLNNSGKTLGDGGTALDTININKWVHIALTRDGSNVIRAYLNGVLQTETHTDSDDWDYRYICSRDNGGSFAFDGYTCNLGIWSDALTLAQIKSIMWKQYADLTTSEKTSLVSFWNLDDLPQASNSYRLGTNKGHIYYSEGASDHGSNIAIKEFLPGNGLELGSDVFGGEGSFSSDTGYWSLSNDTTISNGVVITDSGSGNYNGIAKSSILTAGKIYKLSFDVIEANTPDTLIRLNWGDYTDAADDAYPVIWSNTSGSTDTTGSYYIYFEPGANTATTFIIYVSQSGTGNYAEVKLDNIVCQEVSNPGEPK